MKKNLGFTPYGSPVIKLAKPSSRGMTTLYKSKAERGFTLIELLVVIAIISLLSSVIAASLSTTRKKARDSQRIQNARQIAIALEQYEATNNTYKVANSGLSDSGSGYVAKSGSGGYTNSILSTLKSAGLYSNANLKDPVYGLDNYYLGLCTSTNAYNVFVKMEQSEYNNSTTSISNTCGGAEASALGFNFIASTAGGASGGGGSTSGFAGSYESGMSAPGALITGPDGLTYGTVTAEDGRIWLDRNLGATQVATAYNDYLAYGSKFQWGRLADGHQLINYTSATAGTAVNGITSIQSTTSIPLNNLFVATNYVFYDWVIPRIDSLWQGVNGTNNPCPTGFRVPTLVEWQTWVTALGGFTTATCGVSTTCRERAFNSTLKFTTAGQRIFSDGAVGGQSFFANYFSSTIHGSDSAEAIYWDSGNIILPHWKERAQGCSVRCIKN